MPTWNYGDTSGLPLLLDVLERVGEHRSHDL